MWLIFLQMLLQIQIHFPLKISVPTMLFSLLIVTVSFHYFLGHSWRAIYAMCIYMYICVYAIAIVLNVTEIWCIISQYGVLEIVIVLTLARLSFLFMPLILPYSVCSSSLHAHTLTKLKRLFTFDCFSVPFHSWPITVTVHENDNVCNQHKPCLYCFCLFFCLLE